MWLLEYLGGGAVIRSLQLKKKKKKGLFCFVILYCYILALDHRHNLGEMREETSHSVSEFGGRWKKLPQDNGSSLQRFKKKIFLTNGRLL